MPGKTICRFGNLSRYADGSSGIRQKRTGAQERKFQRIRSGRPDPVIHWMRISGDIQMGGTMRLGAYPCAVTPGTKLAEAYSQEEVAKDTDTDTNSTIPTEKSLRKQAWYSQVCPRTEDWWKLSSFRIRNSSSEFSIIRNSRADRPTLILCSEN